MHQSEYMLAIAAAWTWLDIDIPLYTYGILDGTVHATKDTEWLERLLNTLRDLRGVGHSWHVYVCMKVNNSDKE
ncbi:hypothetical protein OH77DRAFT_1518075 [Trametes cingulata]|nr:hypothetical protein OH77DRAFT_1518075 [Trametes cingulata]